MLECDYLVVGTGASGMAFADAVISESSDRTLIMIDKLAEPGGHWNHAYDFCRLHQPAKYYGVASEKLEKQNTTKSLNYHDLSSKQEILDYFRYVLDKLIRTGRVQHFGECTYQYKDTETKHEIAEPLNNNTQQPQPSYVLHSFTDKEGRSQTVKVKRRLVDATYQKIKVPSTHLPSYQVHPDVDCIPINGLSSMTPKTNKTFVVVGAGKTGIDAVLYLLDTVEIHPEQITWIMPRDAWLYDRDIWAPETLLLNAHKLLNECSTLQESLLTQEKEGVVLRIDPKIQPTKYSCATVNTDELQKLRTIKNVIRKGRVVSITPTHLIMTNGEKIPYPARSVVVDCSANGLAPKPVVPIFQPHKLVLQPIEMCIICLGAAATGYVECHSGFADDSDRNRIMTPTPYPTNVEDSVGGELVSYHNQFVGIGGDPRTERWYNSCRLKYDSHSSYWTIVQLVAGRLYFALRDSSKALDAKKIIYQRIHKKEFPLAVYVPANLAKLIQQLGIVMVFFWVAMVGGLMLLVSYVS